MVRRADGGKRGWCRRSRTKPPGGNMNADACYENSRQTADNADKTSNAYSAKALRVNTIC